MTDDRAWWDVLGIDRSVAASWHRKTKVTREGLLRVAFLRAVQRLDKIAAHTVVPLLNAHAEALEEYRRG